MEVTKIKKFEKVILTVTLLLFIVGGMAPVVLAQEGSAQVVNFKDLIKFLPDAPSGWEGEEPDGMTFTVQDGSWSMATKSYSKSGSEDITAEISISDYTAYAFGWQGTWGSHIEWESTEGHAKSRTFEGYPAWEVYTVDSNDYLLLVGINERFIVSISTNDNKNSLESFANSIDFKGIGKLGGSTPSMGSETQSEVTQETPEKESTDEEDTEEQPGFEIALVISGMLVVAYFVRKRK